MHPNLVDLGLIAVFALAIVDGYRRGFAPYATELTSFGLGLGFAFAFFGPLGGALHAGLHVDRGVAGFGAFLMLLVAGHAAVQGTVHRIGLRAGRLPRPRLPNDIYRAAGAVPAAGVAAMLAALLLSALLVLPGEQRSLVSASLLGSGIAERTGFIQDPLRVLLVPAVRESKHILQNDPVPSPGEDAFYRLDFPATLVVELDAPAEERMFQRINRARREAGLSPLRLDATLQESAREHSRDMYLRHYFSHQTPDHKTPYDRFRDLHLRYVTAGENIAFAPTADQAWDSLMHSPDHRANILNPDFRCVGVGAYKGLGGYEEMFTQDFADCT